MRSNYNEVRHDEVQRDNGHFLLERAMAINNAVFADSSFEDSTFRQGGNNDLQVLRKGLTYFHMLLVQRGGGGSGHSANMVTTSHEVSISFGAPLVVSAALLGEQETPIPRRGDLVIGPRSQSSEKCTGLYLFIHPIVFGHSFPISNNIGSSPSSMSDSTSRPSFPSFLSVTRSICVLVGCAIFNVALLNHHRVVVHEDARNAPRVRHTLLRSLKLYESSQALLQSRLEDIEVLCTREERNRHASSACQEADRVPSTTSLQEEMRMLRVLLIAVWNNMSHIHYFLESFAQAQFCLQRSLVLIGNTTRGYTRQNPIAMELVNQALFNVLLFRKVLSHSPAAAA